MEKKNKKRKCSQCYVTIPKRKWNIGLGIFETILIQLVMMIPILNVLIFLYEAKGRNKGLMEGLWYETKQMKVKVKVSTQ